MGTKMFVTSLILSLSTLVGCTTTSLNSQNNTEPGAGLAYSSSNNGWGAALGAGSGALVGNQIGQTQARPNYQGGGSYN